MKTLKSLLYVLAAGLFFAGCSDDETYTTGEQENPDCYGVYFPSQANIADLELDPADEPALSFTVRRTKSEGEITVPVTISSAQGDEIFDATEIEFADGQEETTFVISFPDTEIGTTYTCEVNVDDPLYASTYTERSTGFSFTVTRVKWVLVTGPNGETTGKWRDEFITELYSLGDEGEIPYAEKDVEIYERADKPGYYRISNIYDEAFVATLFGKIYSNTLPVPTNIIIDATKNVTDTDVAGVVSDKKGVYFPAQSMGFQHTDNGEDFWIVSFCKENYPTASASDYGEIKDGILSFPDDAILLTLPSIWEKTSYYMRNTDMTRLIFPGFKAYDYSLVLMNAEPENGEIMIGMKFGADVAKVKYAFFEGELSDALANIRAGEIESGETASKELTETGVLTTSFDATGVYTIVANIYNAKNELVDVEHLSFGYVKAGDEEEKAVVISCGITITNKYAPQGLTSEDSAEIYIYGQDIVSGSFALVETDKISGDLAAYIAANGEKFTEAQLEKINTTGLSGVIGNLVGGTEYTLIVNAFNGYVSKIITATATTEGTPHPLKRSYTAADLINGVSLEDLYASKWNYYAVDLLDKGNTKRQYIGEVAISENTAPDEEGVALVNVKGLSGLVQNKNFSGDDTMSFEWEDGFLYSLAKQQIGTYANYPVSYYMLSDDFNGYYNADYALVGGLVDEGYIAFVGFPEYITQSKINFVGFWFAAFTDETFTTKTGNLTLYYNLMLVDPAVDDRAPSTTAKKSMHSFRELAMNVMTPDNFVELRGRERMHALIDEMKANKSARNFAETIYPVEMPALDAAEATTKFEAGRLLQRGSIDTRVAKQALRVR